MASPEFIKELEEFTDEPGPWSTLTWNLMTMVLCWTYKFNWVGEKCYDNIWADYMFNSPDGTTAKPRGIQKYIDIFSTNGFLGALAFSFVFWGAKELVAAWVDLMIMSSIFFFTPSIRLCDRGEYVLFGFDLCEDLFLGGESRGIIEIGEIDEEGRLIY